MIKINIQFPFDKYGGGGNQFLKALRDEFVKLNIYEKVSENADVILFNSHHNLREVIKLKLEYPKKIFVHRIDGPIYYIRGFDIELDHIVHFVNKIVADISIFQSHFSYVKNKTIGYKTNKFEKVIYNAPDNKIFNKMGRTKFNQEKKRIIATSWSANWKKGFDVYKYLDKKLNFNKYEFIFAGHSPTNFNNIKQIGAVNSRKLPYYLKSCDVYITASRNDPCSNALIEAISCGLVCIAYNDGGHPELIKKGGLLFDKKEDIPNLLDEIFKNYEKYLRNLPEYTISKTSNEYLEIIEKMRKLQRENKYIQKKIHLLSYLNLHKLLFLQELQRKFKEIVKKR